jgi:Domain of unknown function DUF11
LTKITTRRVVGAAAVAAALGAFLPPLTTTASAATTPPTFATAFSPTTIAVGESATLAFTITDTNSSGTESGIGFTDTLPAGLVVDSQNGESGSCGSTAATPVTADPGSSTISLTGGSLKGGAAGSTSATCSVSVDVTSNTPGNYTNPVTTVTTASDGSATSQPATLAVAGNPTLSVTSPKNNATYNYGQKVVVSYSCAEGEFGPGLVDCSASDDNGNTIASGALLDTEVVGPDQDLFVDSTSNDGAVADDDITYTVLPNNEFTIVKTSAGKNGTVILKLKVPGAGKLVIGEKADGKSFSGYSGEVNGAKTVTITLKPSSTGKKLLAKIIQETHPKLTGKLSIAYTPTAGKKKTATVAVKLKS